MSRKVQGPEQQYHSSSSGPELEGDVGIVEMIPGGEIFSRTERSQEQCH